MKDAVCQGYGGPNWIKTKMVEGMNLSRKAVVLADMLVGTNTFIGVSALNTITTEIVKTMNKDVTLFTCGNPTLKFFDEVKAGGVRGVLTGRSGDPNQINNVLVFFGIFRGTFDVHASNTNEEMKAIAEGRLAGLADDDLSENYITL